MSVSSPNKFAWNCAHKSLKIAPSDLHSLQLVQSPAPTILKFLVLANQA